MLLNFFIIFFLLNLYLVFGKQFFKYFFFRNTDNQLLLSEYLLCGIFSLSFFFLFTNFFLPTQNIYLYPFLISIFFLLIYKNFFFIKKNCKNLLIISALFAPISLFLDPGIDGGLYHLPFQKNIQDYNISFGLANLHNRYALTGITNYFNSFIWKNNFLNILLSNQTIFFSIFFISIRDHLLFGNKLEKILSTSSLIILPLWYRYAPLNYGTVDIIYTIFVYLNFLYITKIVFNFHQQKQLLINLFIFFLITCFAIAVKPSGIILSISILLIIFFYRRYFLFNFKIILKNNYIFIIFLIFWAIRNFIISGCLIYPVIFTCVNTSWFDTENTNNLFASIYIWNAKYLYVAINILLSKFSSKYILIFIILLFFIIILNKKKNMLYLNKKKKIIFLLILSIFIFHILILPDINLITFYIEEKKNDLLKNIILKEFYFILFFYLVAFLYLAGHYKNKVINFNNFKSEKSMIFLLYFLVLLIVWWSNAPNPRLGQYLFPLALIVFIPSCTDFKSIYIDKYFNNLAFVFSLFFILYIGLIKNFDKIKFEKLFFSTLESAVVEVSQRKTHGYKPANVTNSCWGYKDCYPYEDVIIYHRVWIYNFFKRVN